MRTLRARKVNPPTLNTHDQQAPDETTRLFDLLKDHITRTKDLDAIMSILDQPDLPPLPQGMTSWELQTLLLAVESGDMDMVRQLIFDRKIIRSGDWGKRLLFGAIKEGLQAMALFLISECQVDVEVLNKDGLTPLMMAAECSMLEVVRYLVHVKKVDAKAKDDDGLDVAAWAAIGAGGVEMMRFLVEEVGFDIGAKYETLGDQLVHMVAVSEKRGGKNNLALFKWLVLEKGADTRAMNEGGLMPLHCAAEEGNLPILQFLIDEMGIPVDTPTTSEKATALHIACDRGHLKVVEWLVGKAGADIHVRDVHGQIPRDLAVSRGHHAIAIYLDSPEPERKAQSITSNLLKKTASTGDIEGIKRILSRPNLPPPLYLPSWDQWALLAAAISGQSSLVRYLILHRKVDPNYVPPKGADPLLITSIVKDQEAVALFLIQEAKVDVNISGVEGMTPLMWAAYKGMMSVVRCLVLDRGVDIKTRDNKGWDAACYAVHFNQLEVLSFLVEEGALDVGTVYDEDGYQLLHLVAGRGQMEMVRCLVEVGGADVRAQDIEGRLPRDCAAANKHMAIVSYLEAKTTTTASRDGHGDDEGKADGGAAAVSSGGSGGADGSKAERNRKRMAKKKRNKAKRAAAEAASMGGGEVGIGDGGQDVEEEGASRDRDTQELEGGQEEGGGVGASSGVTTTSHPLEPTEEVVVESTREPTDPTSTGLPSDEEKEEAKGQEEEEEEVFDEKAYLLEGAPDHFICPISFELMTDPVTARDGHTYHRPAIQQHIDLCREKGKPLLSPMTLLPMHDDTLMDVVFIKTTIREYIENKLRQRQEGGGGGGAV